MLKEQEVTPGPQGQRRRCFRGDWLEALLTYDAPGGVVILHVTYLAPYRGVFVLRWSRTDGYRHYRVGFDSGGAERVTCPDAAYQGEDAPDRLDKGELRGRVFVGGAKLEPRLRAFLTRTIEAYPWELRRCEFCRDRRPADCSCRDCDRRACIPCVRKDAFLGSPCIERTLHEWRGTD